MRNQNPGTKTETPEIPFTGIPGAAGYHCLPQYGQTCEFTILKIVFLDVLEIAVCIHFEITYCKFISYDNAVFVGLEG